MKPTELKTLIAARFKAGIKRPIHVVSSPGVGKTQIARQVANEMGVAFRIIHAPLMQPEDYGFPVISQSKEDVSFIVSKDKFPLALDPTCPEVGILCLDELPQSDPSGQKVLANLLQEREIHGKYLKAGWMIITTGNRTTDRAGANRILSHLNNRITTIELDANLDDWVSWAIENKVKNEVVSFLNFVPKLLNAFNPQQEINPTPRAWVEGVSEALGVVGNSLEFETFKGDVGEGPAAEFTAFLKIYRNLPNVEHILLGKSGVKVPTDPATRYALCGALASRADMETFGNALKYVESMTAEFVVLFVRDAVRHSAKLTEHPDFLKWVMGPGAKVLGI